MRFLRLHGGRSVPAGSRLQLRGVLQVRSFSCDRTAITAVPEWQLRIKTEQAAGSAAVPAPVQCSPRRVAGSLKTSREFSEGSAVREGNRVGNVSRQFPQIGLSDMRKRHFCGGNGVVNRCGGGKAGEAETVPPSNQIF